MTCQRRFEIVPNSLQPARRRWPYFATLLALVAVALSGALMVNGQSAAGDPTIEKAFASQATENLAPDAKLTGKASAPASPMAWWYCTPATKFWEGLPIGSGRFGAMVYGRVRDEVIPFNDETLWTGQPYNPVNPKALASLPEIRRLLLEAKFGEAAELATNLLSHPVPFGIYTC